MKKIQEGVAFFNEEFSVKKELEKLTPFTHQIEDFSSMCKQIDKKTDSLSNDK